MDKDEIRALEPKYTGNTRHLSEGEAAAIANDPANDEGENVTPGGMASTAVLEEVFDDTQSLATDNTTP